MLYNCGVHIIAVNCSSALTSSSLTNVTWPSTRVADDDTRSSRKSATGSQAIIDIYVTTPLILIGIVCNVLSIVVLRRDKEHHGTVFFLQALSVADTLYLIAASLRYPLRYLLPSEDCFIQVQPFVFPLLKTFQTITIWMMVLVTVHRFACVCAPLTSPLLFNTNTRRRSVVTVFCCGVLYNVPRFFDSCVYRWHDPCTQRSPTRMLYRKSFSNSYYYDIYIDGLYMALLYIGPLTTIILINCRLVQAIRYSRQRSAEVHVSPAACNQLSLGRFQNSHSTIPPGSVSDDRSATVVLLIVVVVFVICETPELILKVMSFADRNFDYGLFSRDFIRLNSASQVLMVLNSSVNFFIYAIFGRRFRRILRETLFHFSFRFRSGSATRDSLPELRYHHNCVHDQGAGRHPSRS